MATSTPPRAPHRDLAQRMTALANANRVRSYRAELKRDLVAGRRSIVDVILLVEEEVDAELMDTAKVLDVLLKVPKIGRVKALKILGTARISPSKTLGGLTQRQRAELVGLLAPYDRRPR